MEMGRRTITWPRMLMVEGAVFSTVHLFETHHTGPSLCGAALRKQARVPRRNRTYYYCPKCTGEEKKRREHADGQA